MLLRLRIGWLAIVAFLPLYALVGQTLRARVGPPTVDLGVVHVALGAAFAVLALAVRPLAVRGGLHPAPASLVAWAAAEAVAIVGLVGWVESGEARAYAVGAAVSFALLLALFPRAAPAPDGRMDRGAAPE